MAHGGQKGAFGTVGVVGQFFGCAQLIHKVAPFTDVDPASDNALDLAQRVAEGQDPVIDGEGFTTDIERAIQDQRGALSHDAQVVGLIIVGFALIAQQAAGLHHRFANDVFTPG